MTRHPDRAGKSPRRPAIRSKPRTKTKPRNAGGAVFGAGGHAASGLANQRANFASMRAFLDPKGFVVVDRVVKHFGMSKQQFAETIGVKPETVYRATRVSAPKTQARATEMLEIIARIANWAGGERQAMAWYRSEPIPAFGGRTAESLVKAGKAVAVRDYLDHVATGGFA